MQKEEQCQSNLSWAHARPKRKARPSEGASPKYKARPSLGEQACDTIAVEPHSDRSTTPVDSFDVEDLACECGGESGDVKVTTTPLRSRVLGEICVETLVRVSGELREFSSSVKAAMESAQIDIQSAYTELLEVNSALGIARDELQDLQNEKQIVEAERKEVNNTLEELRDEFRDWQQRSDDAVAASEGALAASVSRRVKVRMKTKKELERLGKVVASRQKTMKELRELRAQLTCLRSEQENERSAREEAVASKHETLKEVEHLRAQLNRLRSEQANERTSYEAVRDLIKFSTEELEHLQRSNRNAVEERTSLLSQQRHLFEQTRTQAEELERVQHQRMCEYQDLERIRLKRSHEESALVASKHKTLKEVEHLHAQLNRLRSEKENERSSHEEVVASKHEMLKEVEHLRAQLNRLRSEQENERTSHEAVRDLIKVRTEELEHVQHVQRSHSNSVKVRTSLLTQQRELFEQIRTQAEELERVQQQRMCERQQLERIRQKRSLEALVANLLAHQNRLCEQERSRVEELQREAQAKLDCVQEQRIHEEQELENIRVRQQVEVQPRPPADPPPHLRLLPDWKRVNVVMKRTQASKIGFFQRRCLLRARGHLHKIYVGGLKRVRPGSIRFTHARISSHFRNGYCLDSVVEELLEGTLHPDDFPPIQVVEHDGSLHSLSNRRLFVFRVAESLGKIHTIPARVLSPTSPWLLSKWERAYTTQNTGKSVQVQSKYLDCQILGFPLRSRTGL